MALVGRSDAGRLLTIMAAAFGATVILTRAYLVAMDYPKIGSGQYHIAHALWGGLLLVIAALLMLLYANRSVLTLGAALSGIGTGLFIDEVGKFITTTNDYFFPLAAPLIYVAFMLVVLVARYAATMRPQDPHQKLLTAIDSLPDLVDGRMTRSEFRDLRVLLEQSRTHESSKGLAEALEQYVDSHPELALREMKRESKFRTSLRVLERALFPRPVLRLLILAALTAHLIWSITRLSLTAAFASGADLDDVPFDEAFNAHHIFSHPSALAWFGAVAAELVAALLYAHAVYSLLRRDDWEGIRSAIWATMVSLIAVNALTSYFQQFVIVLAALAEGALLLVLLRYRVRFGPP